ncbi:unnamed protein product, partial [Callosobruchus maculatus]
MRKKCRLRRRMYESAAAAAAAASSCSYGAAWRGRS